MPRLRPSNARCTTKRTAAIETPVSSTHIAATPVGMPTATCTWLCVGIWTGWITAIPPITSTAETTTAWATAW